MYKKRLKKAAILLQSNKRRLAMIFFSNKHLCTMSQSWVDIVHFRAIRVARLELIGDLRVVYVYRCI
jgi:hypothetical protein